VSDRDPLPVVEKVRLATAAWVSLAVVAVDLRRHPLPDVVRRLSRPAPRATSRSSVEPRRLGRIVMRSLWIGPFRPRCLFTALVLYRLLQRQGTPAELVIGLPEEAVTKDAHAWIEVDGVDVGPPPGSRGHAPFARYGVQS
jgi:hypothetical protein